MSKHTPGPWETVEGPPAAIHEVRPDEPVHSGPGHTVFADTRFGPVIVASHTWNAANAHLIAAAPELLKALKVVTAAVAGARPLDPDEWQAALDAIAKAEGK